MLVCVSMTTLGQASSETAQVTPTRNYGVDAYRGLVMLLMMAEVLRLSTVARAFPGNFFWATLAYNQTHVEWAGCSLHDLIQPSFSFLVGVALPYSIASRLQKNGRFGNMFLQAVRRALVLIVLGFFLRSIHSTQTYYTFEDTLTQIGLGYPFLFLLGFRSPRWQWGAFGAILLCYWLAWAAYPAPGPNYDYSAVGVPQNWPENFTGFASHWNKNSNLGNAFDQWFLNLFPRAHPFVFNGGGYLTLSFIPTLATMMSGLIAGRRLKLRAPSIPFKPLLIAGAVGIAAGLLLHQTGVCPIVKRIWTPSWTIFSSGVCCLLLAAFSWTVQLKGRRTWALPLIVIGTNSIAAYLIAHLTEDFVASSLRIHFGQAPFRIFGAGLEPLLFGATVLSVEWVLLFWMYRLKIFLRI